MSKKAAKKATKTESGAKGKGGHLDATKKSPKDKTKGASQASKTVPTQREAASEEPAHPAKDGKRRVQVTVAASTSETKAARRSKGNIIAVPSSSSAERDTEVAAAAFANSPFAAGPDDADTDVSHERDSKRHAKSQKPSSHVGSNKAKKKGSLDGEIPKQGKRSSKTSGETSAPALDRAAASESITEEVGAEVDGSSETKKASRRGKGKGAENASSRRKPSKSKASEKQAKTEVSNPPQPTPSSDADARKRGAQNKSSKKAAAKLSGPDDTTAGSNEVDEPEETIVDPSAESARERELEMAESSPQPAAPDVPGDDEDEDEDETSILGLDSDQTAETDEEELSEEEENQRYLKGIIEALLFASDKPLTARELARAARIDKKRTVQLLAELRREYRHRGVNIIEVSGGFVLRSNPAYGAFVQKALALRPVKLSRAQLETLAIVAYRQPITRPEIDDIRGVDSGQVLKGLADRDLIKMVGKKDEAGRPMLYGTTDAFLELFTLESLKGLPSLREFTELSEDSREKFTQATGEAMPGPTEVSDADAEELGEAAVESGSDTAEGEPDGAEPDGAEPDAAEPDGAAESEGSGETDVAPSSSSDDVVSAEAASEMAVAVPGETELDEAPLEVDLDAPPPKAGLGETDTFEVDLEPRTSETARSRLDAGAVQENELDPSVSAAPDDDWSDVGASDPDDELR